MKHLDRDDIDSFIERITDGEFKEYEKNMIIDKVNFLKVYFFLIFCLKIFEEADIDGNNQIKFEEFNHIANKYSKDFHK